MVAAIERITMIKDGTAPPPGIARLLGFRLTDVRPGRVAIEFDAGPEHANPMGTLHGGVFCDLADAAMGYAYAGRRRRPGRPPPTAAAPAAAPRTRPSGEGGSRTPGGPPSPPAAGAGWG